MLRRTVSAYFSNRIKDFSRDHRKVITGFLLILFLAFGAFLRIYRLGANDIGNQYYAATVKFMGEQSHPRIEIGVRGADEGGDPILSVSDDGIGIEPQYHEKVFG
jgi:hypothetical protein